MTASTTIDGHRADAHVHYIPDLSRYGTGYCDAMAIALHDAGLGDLAVWTLWHADEDGEEWSEPVHMAVTDGCGRWTDAFGTHVGMPGNLLSLHGVPVAVTLEPCSRDEALFVFTMEGVAVLFSSFHHLRLTAASLMAPS